MRKAMKKLLLLAALAVALVSCSKPYGGLELGTYVAESAYDGLLTLELMDGGKALCYFKGQDEEVISWYSTKKGLVFQGYVDVPSGGWIKFDPDNVVTVESPRSFYLNITRYKKETGNTNGFLAFTKRN